jgi:uncharacterized phage-associated protein
MSSVLQIPVAVRKATQSLNYFAHLSASGAPPKEINKMKALKLLFFADRYHLRKYGRPVSDCAYFAMKNGPVASEAKSVAEESAHLPPQVRSYARRFVRKSGSYDVGSVANVDTDVLSETDVEALKFAWKTFGHYTKFELVDITHHYPEWKRHEKALDGDTHKRVPMSYEDFFAEPDTGYNPCHELTSKERAIGRELFRDRQAFEQLWS